MPPRIAHPTLFIEKDSWLHRIHPFNKLCYILLIGVSVYLLPGEWLTDSVLLLINLGCLLTGGIFKPAFKFLWKTMLPLAVFMVPIHGILYPENHTVILSLPWFSVYNEGLLFALNTLLQLSIVLIASLIFVFTTHPADLISTISQTAGSPTLAYLIGSPLLLLPAMRERITAIQSAQRSRGLETQGSLLKRCFGLFPLLIPLVLGSLIEIEQRSIALELRGFKSGHPKTYLRTVPDSTAQKRGRQLMLAVTICIIGYRVGGY
ncbi:MAG: energy-coupling factor transporter transmembrane protein EcfT [Desulfobacterales bacterium]|nr:energy-coupling factor transporter transmembrane protein EcfT [Desulfobacterales bacterium]